MMRPFGGRNPEFGVNHVLRCLFILRRMMLSSLEHGCLCLLCLNVSFSLCYFCTYDPALQMMVVLVKDDQEYYRYFKCFMVRVVIHFAGHSDDDMLVVMK